MAPSQPKFTLPPIHDNPGGAWGPSTSHFQTQFKDVPYAPYSKSDKLGRFADWNDLDARDTRGGAALATGGQAASRGATQTGRFAGGRRDGPQAYGSGSTNAFAYFHVEDEASFSLVDNKTGGGVRKSAQGGYTRGRAVSRGTAASAASRTGARGAARGGAAQASRNVQASRGGRRGWKDWDKASRTRESSVPISPNWKMLEEIEYSRLTKLRLDVEEPETLESHGKLYAYDKTYDRVNTKAERPLQPVDRIRYNPTTSDDPIIQRLAESNTATVYATDSILSLLMCAPRSVYPWDIVIIREGDKLFLDKRDGGPFDLITVNENAADPPLEGDKESINSLMSLSLEATYLNQNLAFQVVKEDTPLDFPNPNPFHAPDETEVPAGCGYRYRLYDLSVHEEEDVKLVVRTEVDAFLPGATPTGDNGFVTIRALNEFDSRAQGAGGAPDWRSKLDSQRGAVVATEMKNNSNKLAKWAVQSILAGAEALKIGYVSRANPRDNSRHVILSTATMRPAEFAGQLNVSLSNGWGIVRTVTDLCMKFPDGKYLLVKDPNRSVIRLYSVPMSAFTGEDDDEFIADEEPAEGN